MSTQSEEVGDFVVGAITIFFRPVCACAVYPDGGDAGHLRAEHVFSGRVTDVDGLGGVNDAHCVEGFLEDAGVGFVDAFTVGVDDVVECQVVGLDRAVEEIVVGVADDGERDAGAQGFEGGRDITEHSPALEVVVDHVRCDGDVGGVKVEFGGGRVQRRGSMPGGMSRIAPAAGRPIGHRR